MLWPCRIQRNQKVVGQSACDRLQIDMHSPKPDCVACTEAKLSEAPYGPASGHQTKPGELTHMDLWGKYNMELIHGNQYYLLMIDDAARYITIEFLKTKDQAVQ